MERDPVSKVTELASGQINGHDTITVELIEADETPLAKQADGGCIPVLFPTAADAGVRTLAAAAVRLAVIKRERRL
jgi:hypothetical protein